MTPLARRVLGVLPPTAEQSITIAQMCASHPGLVPGGADSWYRYAKELLRLGYAHRSNHAAHTQPGQRPPYRWWRTAAGATAAQEAHPEPQDVHDALTDPGNDTRIARAFRATLRRFGLCSMKGYRALRGDRRREFEASWTDAMKDLLLREEGVTIPDQLAPRGRGFERQVA